MDTIFTRLDEASRIGDVDSLRRLLEEDKFLLERVTARTSIGDNPLHIAALLGHADFAAQIISVEPDLTKQRNGQGMSPLHLAAAHGHLPVVKELLKVQFQLCLVREEKEGLIPLHLAVINGRALVIKELVEACEAAIHELTHVGETVIHLAMNSSSLDTLEFLISKVDDVNAKDVNGNTVLHLAVARKQLSVVKLLLSNPRIDVNSMNSKTFTPLDVLFESPQEYGDLVLGEMIRVAGGKTRDEMMSSQNYLSGEISSEDLGSPLPLGRSNDPRSRLLSSKYDIGKANLESQKKTEGKSTIQTF
ncbi:hypothetical protein LUZ60_014932 [Juncus effusus]|nr:hypothetical protein LUZ60_014932 [Juncus effusus]